MVNWLFIESKQEGFLCVLFKTIDKNRDYEFSHLIFRWDFSLVLAHRASRDCFQSLSMLDLFYENTHTLSSNAEWTIYQFSSEARFVDVAAAVADLCFHSTWYCVCIAMAMRWKHRCSICLTFDDVWIVHSTRNVLFTSKICFLAIYFLWCRHSTPVLFVNNRNNSRNIG